MKLSFAFNEDGSLDGTFTDPEEPTNSCTVMIVPPLKTTSRKKVQFRQELQPRVEEVDSSDDEEEEEN
jgi:hypothetical protein